MGRVFSRGKQSREMKERHQGLDLWLLRGAHASQLLLLVLGVFGYFYTVRPIHQKEVLDEEIAEKRMEVRNKERQLQAVTEDIRKKSNELAEKEKLLASARFDASTARSEARDAYDALRLQYLGVVSGDFARCAQVAIEKDLDGSELKRCPESVAERNSYMLEKLKPGDRQLLMSLVKAAAKEAQPALDILVIKQRQQLEKLRQELGDVQKQLDDVKGKEESAEASVRLASVASQIRLTMRIDGLRGEQRRVRIDGYRDLYKALEAGGDKIRNKFLDAT